MLSDKINADIKTAMLARQEARLRALRSIKAALLLAATEKGAAEAVTDEKATQVLQKLAKQRKDSMDIYQQNGRDDLYNGEKEELEVISEYLPAQMSEGEITLVLSQIIAETGATSAAEIGKVMPVAMKQLAGKADGKTIQTLLKTLLG
ncbi:MAG: GatB/YqeY domain-containing protein [Flavobacteriaceae bacterium]|nr:GatB/YqeY domain-containing protein [Flavobacteriaceae bacterium]